VLFIFETKYKKQNKHLLCIFVFSYKNMVFLRQRTREIRGHRRSDVVA
jgi:hypothetical protein